MAVVQQGGRELLTPGQFFGIYRVVRRLGRGGMGMVYLLENPEDGSQLAAKLLYPEKAAADPQYLQRFLHEAEFAMRIRHPNLIAVYDVGQDPDTGYYYIIMEYVPGGNVSERLRRKGRFAIAEAVGIIEQVATALEAAHECHVVHRDIKPDNIMFAADGTPKLADMGIAKFNLRDDGDGDAVMTLSTRLDEEEDSSLTMAGRMVGTPAYMAPEQITDSHGVDIRADIYSLGLVFFEMLTGRRYNDGLGISEIVERALAGETIPDVRTFRPEISAQIAQLLNAMCVPDRDQRIATPEEVVSVFKRLKERAVADAVSSPKPRSKSLRSLVAAHPVALAGGVLTLLAALLLPIGLNLTQKPPPEAVPPPKVPPPKVPPPKVPPPEVPPPEVPPPEVPPPKVPPPKVPPPKVKPPEAKPPEVKPPPEPAVWEPRAPKIQRGPVRKFLFKDANVPPLEFVECPGTAGKPSFWISTKEVTGVQWRDVLRVGLELSDLDSDLGAPAAAIYGCRTDGFFKRLNDDEVMRKGNEEWQKAVQDGKGSQVFRLPTEEEWRRAARADVTAEDDIYVRAMNGKLDANAYAKIAKTVEDVRTELRRKKDDLWCADPEAELEKYVPPLAGYEKWPNAWGIYDMAGNGRGELVWDASSGRTRLLAVDVSATGYTSKPIREKDLSGKQRLPYTFRVVFGKPL